MSPEWAKRRRLRPCQDYEARVDPVDFFNVDDLFIFCDFCIFAFSAKVLDFEGLSMETFIRLWPILNFDSPRASNELTNDV